jgi:signal transduction histidine kinase
MPASVLVCDNEDVLRALVRAALDERGYEIAEARDGEESLEVARRTKPDLIVLDMLMPARSGLEVLSELRRDPDLATTPVIVLTARAQASDREAALRAEADRFVVKPFSPRELAAVVDELLEESRSVDTPNVHVTPTPRARGRERYQSLARERVAWAEAQADRVPSEGVAQLADLGAVLDAAEEAIRVVDPSGREIVLNAAMERLLRELGLPSGTGPYSLERELVDRGSEPVRYRNELQTVIDDAELVARHEVEHADSGRILQRYTAPVRDSLGGVIGRIFVLREVTAERTAARAREELIATVSHELRTPLTGISGFAEILLNQNVHADARRRHLETLYGEVKRLTSLLDTLLDMERPQDHRVPLSPAPFRLDQLLEDGVELFSAESSAHAISLELPDGPLEVVADRDRIAQVVANLLSNAIKYSPGGGTIRVWAQRSDSTVRVVVEDSGIGIPEDQQEQVFSRFFRAESSGARGIGGLGLGLALSREIIAAQGGELRFESTEGKGSTFWFELPEHPARA